MRGSVLVSALALAGCAVEVVELRNAQPLQEYAQQTAGHQVLVKPVDANALRAAIETAAAWDRIERTHKAEWVLRLMRTKAMKITPIALSHPNQGTGFKSKESGRGRWETESSIPWRDRRPRNLMPSSWGFASRIWGRAVP